MNIVDNKTTNEYDKGLAIHALKYKYDPKYKQTVDLNKWQAKVDAPLVDTSFDIIPAISGVAKGVTNLLPKAGLAKSFADTSTVKVADESRRHFLKSIPLSVAGAKVASNPITLSEIGKGVAKIVSDKKTDIASTANKVAQTHRIGLNNVMDKILLDKKKYTMDTYGVPTVELSKYKKLLKEDVVSGKYPQEVADAKINAVKNVVTNNFSKIQNDEALFNYKNKLEDARRSFVGSSTKADNIKQDITDLINGK